MQFWRRTHHCSVDKQFLIVPPQIFITLAGQHSENSPQEKNQPDWNHAPKPPQAEHQHVRGLIEPLKWQKNKHGEVITLSIAASKSSDTSSETEEHYVVEMRQSVVKRQCVSPALTMCCGHIRLQKNYIRKKSLTVRKGGDLQWSQLVYFLILLPGDWPEHYSWRIAVVFHRPNRAKSIQLGSTLNPQARNLYTSFCNGINTLKNKRFSTSMP